jgi:hypothetical protein
MLPEFEDGIQSAHGMWRIERNQIVKGTSDADATRETIIVLTEQTSFLVAPPHLTTLSVVKITSDP